MLRHTFVHLPGVGPVTERKLWGSGITTWQEFSDASPLPARLNKREGPLRALVADSTARLADGDASYFARSLPSREQWRLWADFRDRAVFLDIETTGLSAWQSHITMVGLLDAEGYRAYLYDENLDDLREALEAYDLVVTFNGASFDLPYVEHHIGSVFSRMAHLDLRFPLRRLGYTGGLKAIESRLGVGRPSDFDGMDGFDAVRLWRLWTQGDKGARDTLVRYNAEDVASLPALADIVYARLSAGLPVPSGPLKPLPRPEVDLPYDLGVIDRLALYRRRFR